MKATKSPARTHRTATASVIWHWPTMWTHEQQESSNRTCWNRHIAWCARVVCSMVCITRSHVIPRSGRTATGPRSHMQRILISSSLSHRHTTHMWTHRGTATCTCVARTHDSGASCVCGFTFYFFSAFFLCFLFHQNERNGKNENLIERKGRIPTAWHFVAAAAERPIPHRYTYVICVTTTTTTCNGTSPSSSSAFGRLYVYISCHHSIKWQTINKQCIKSPSMCCFPYPIWKPIQATLRNTLLDHIFKSRMNGGTNTRREEKKKMP